MLTSAAMTRGNQSNRKEREIVTTSVKARHNGAASTGTDPTTAMYDALYSAIAEKFQPILVNPQTPLQLQFPLSPLPAGWASGLFGQYDQFSLGDDCPISHGLIYLADESQSVYSQYGLWLNGLLSPNRSTDPAYLALAKQLERVNAQISAMYDELSNNFATFQQSPIYDKSITTVTQYIQSAYSGSLGVQYGVLNTQAAGISQDMTQYIAGADPVLSAAKTNFALPGNTTSYACPPPVDKVVGGVLTIGQGDQSLGTDLPNWQAGSFGAQGFGPVPLQVGTVPVYSQVTVSFTIWESDSYFFGLFSDSYETSFSVTEAITTYENFELDVQLSAMEIYPVFRNSWLSVAALTEYSSDGLVGGLTPGQFFDPNTGTLTLIPAYVVVGFNPTLTLTMSTDAYNQYSYAISNSGMKIGPFLVGGANGPKPSVLSSDANQTVLQFATPPDQIASVQPYVMGMVHFVTQTPSGENVSAPGHGRRRRRRPLNGR
jgi:hypothetical protein